MTRMRVLVSCAEALGVVARSGVRVPGSTEDPAIQIRQRAGRGARRPVARRVGNAGADALLAVAWVGCGGSHDLATCSLVTTEDAAVQGLTHR